ncbi:MAG: hypothetical protein P8L68_12540 [Paracoccaceae bacterium]|nr:hypothetical protein [Paracoccaceae bacterium]MDG1737706.1 hypothetical protein [Paracoccaceae bacterium]MDG2259311.1 hypothetical protein [Paracoccaceae bacterium]
MKGDIHDPKALIREAYVIEGITEAQCRSIFLDWALSLPVTMDTQESLAILVARYAVDEPSHPMSEVLRNGQQTMTKPKRRGGWRSRPRN